MLKQEQNFLPVDLLFDDEQIGDFVKSIQIDSPYQQMLLEGVLTENVLNEKLYVSFTVEGYFHYVLGEVIYNRTEGLGAEVLKQIVEKNKLNGAKEGVEQCLIRDVQKGDLSRLMWLIDRCEDNLSLFTLPLANVFHLANFQNNSKELFTKTVEELLKKQTESDLIVLENVMAFFIKSQRHQIYISLALCIFETNLPQNSRSTKLKLHAIKYIDKGSRKAQLEKIYRQLGANRIKVQNATIYIELGLGFRIISEYETALSCFQVALNLLADKKKNTTIRCHHSLGLIYSDLGNYPMSLKHLYLALKITEKTKGKDHFSAYRSYNHIGSILHLVDKKNIIKSINHLKRASRLATLHFGANHTETAIIYNNLGITYAIKKDYKKAEIFYLTAFDVFQSIHPKNDPWIGTIYNNLASLYCSTGELGKALTFQKDAIEIIIYNSGEHDVLTAMMQSTHAKILNSLNRKNEAIEQYQKTIKTFKKKLPIDHLYLQKAHSNLGVVYMENGTFSLAIKCFLHSLKVLNCHGDKYINKKIELIHWITKCYQINGNYNRANFYKKMGQKTLDKLNDL
jgi:tetratricopeptide (TPR) repeat protein